MSVKILREIDVSENKWCNSAVMFRVQNGKGVITHQHGKEDEDYYHYSKLLLNGKPILQEHLPICPTCTGLLATGYGIENIDCLELKAVRECLNNNYTDIITSAEMLKPLLNLLDDGYYLLADVPHDPTDGNNNFFWSVPNNLTENPACCDEYYHYGLCRCTDSFPQYLYPTQSAELCNQKRIDEYVGILCNNSSPPRALAYRTAVKIIKKDYIDLPYKEAWIALLDFRDEQTEQLFIDHIVEYGNKSTYYDIVTSYWD